MDTIQSRTAKFNPELATLIFEQIRKFDESHERLVLGGFHLADEMFDYSELWDIALQLCGIPEQSEEICYDWYWDEWTNAPHPTPEQFVKTVLQCASQLSN